MPSRVYGVHLRFVDRSEDSSAKQSLISANTGNLGLFYALNDRETNPHMSESKKTKIEVSLVRYRSKKTSWFDYSFLTFPIIFEGITM